MTGPDQRLALRRSVAVVVRDPRVLDAIEGVSRDLFVPAEHRRLAWADDALPLADGQTISQPTVVARMAELARLSAGDRVLEVGGGSGYAAAVLARLAATVVSVELRPALAAGARAALAAAGAVNVDVVVADGSLGWPAGAPYDAIVVSAAAPRLPPALVGQLAAGGRLVLPLGRSRQRLVRITRGPRGGLTREQLESVRFVPLTM